MKRHHIRTRIALWFVFGIALVLLAYSGAASFLLLRDLRLQLVRHAIQDIETVEGLLSFDAQGRLTFRDDYHNHPESKLVLERLLEVRSPAGRVLLRNELLGTRSLGDSLLANEGEGGYSQREFVLPGGPRVQMVSRRHSIDGRPTIIRVAYSEEPLWTQFRSNLTSLLIPLPLVMLIAGFAGYMLASHALRPIQQLAKQAQEITSDRLHERLPVNPSDGELADLARVFNSVLLRLEESFQQLKRFTSDASHELRTPLAAIRSVGEVGLQRHCTPEQYQDVIGSMLEEANKLTRLVDTLLVIARADAGQIRLAPTSFPARRLVEECVSLFEVVLEENNQNLVIETSGETTLTGDWLLLRQALMNIIHNAVKFTPRGGRIVVRIRTDSGRVVFEVQDSGPGIPEDQLVRVFDRFYRVDEGRSREQGGAGLGLAIAQWNVQIHGGTITADSSAGQGSTFRITLP